MSALDRETVRIAMTYPQTDGISSVLRANARDVARQLREWGDDPRNDYPGIVRDLADQLDPQPQPVSKTQ